jgi:hypothetical protein
VAKINNKFYTPQRKSPVLLAGLFCMLLLLSSCQIPQTPEEVTKAFWTALIKGEIDDATRLATQNSRHLVTKDETKEKADIRTGQIVINGQTANVETIMTENGRTFSFDTVLLKESDAWKVDYQQTRMNISALPFNGLFNSLEQLGETFNKQLERQMPLFEKQIESFGEQLNRKLDEFGRYLEDPKKWRKEHPYRGDSI